MGRSSILAAFFAVLAIPQVSAAHAVRASGGIRGRPAIDRPSVLHRGARPARRGYVGGIGYGLFGIDQGFAIPPSPLPLPPRPLLPTTALFGGPPAPPRCPLIIEVGGGLQHRARTRIVSGHQGCV